MKRRLGLSTKALITYSSHCLFIALIEPWTTHSKMYNILLIILCCIACQLACPYLCLAYVADGFLDMFCRSQGMWGWGELLHTLVHRIPQPFLPASLGQLPDDAPSQVRQAQWRFCHFILQQKHGNCDHDDKLHVILTETVTNKLTVCRHFQMHFNQSLQNIWICKKF